MKTPVSKKTLQAFYDEQMAITCRPRTPDREGYLAAWNAQNALMKTMTIKRKQRRNRRETLKYQYGLKKRGRDKARDARLRLLGHIALVFNLEPFTDYDQIT